MKKCGFFHKFISSLKLLNKYFGCKCGCHDIHSYNAAGKPDSLTAEILNTDSTEAKEQIQRKKMHRT